MNFVAVRGARGIVVFDGVGEDAVHGPLEVRFAPSADGLLERLAAAHRETESVLLVSSDQAVRGTAGQEVRKRSSKGFLRELPTETAHEANRELQRSRVEDALDEGTRRRLERWRRRRT